MARIPIALLLFVVSVGTVSAGESTRVHDDLEVALREAAAHGKAVLAYFGTERHRDVERRYIGEEAPSDWLRHYVVARISYESNRSLFVHYAGSGTNPCLVVIEPSGIEIERMCGWTSSPSEFLRHSVKIHELYRRGDDWKSTPYTDPSAHTVVTDHVSGWAVAWDGAMLWVGYRTKLRVLDSVRGEVVETFDLSDAVEDYRYYSIADLAVDGEDLWVLPSGWTVGQPLLRWNMRTRSVHQTILKRGSTDWKAYSATGIASDGRFLYVLYRDSPGWYLSKVDPKDGSSLGKKLILAMEYSNLRLSGMDFDGSRLVAIAVAKRPGHYRHPMFGRVALDPESGNLRRLELVDFPVRGIALASDEWFTTDAPRRSFNEEPGRWQVSTRTVIRKLPR